MPPGCPDWDRAETPEKRKYVVLGMAGFHRFIFRNSKHLIIQHGDIKTWHEKIFQQAVPLSYYAGNYRADDPSKPCLQIDVGVPPNSGAPYARVPELMKEFSELLRNYVVDTERYIAKASTMEKARAVVELVAWAVGQIIKIHPFLNGNGRMSRLVANYLLHRFGYPLLYPHPYDRPVSAEYAAASSACMRDDLKPMFRFILTLLAASTS